MDTPRHEWLVWPTDASSHARLNELHILSLSQPDLILEMYRQTLEARHLCLGEPSTCSFEEMFAAILSHESHFGRIEHSGRDSNAESGPAQISQPVAH
jgi:hypothetical protein